MSPRKPTIDWDEARKRRRKRKGLSGNMEIRKDSQRDLMMHKRSPRHKINRPPGTGSQQSTRQQKNPTADAAHRQAQVPKSSRQVRVPKPPKKRQARFKPVVVKRTYTKAQQKAPAFKHITSTPRSRAATRKAIDSANRTMAVAKAKPLVKAMVTPRRRTVVPQPIIRKPAPRKMPTRRIPVRRKPPR